MRRLFTAQDSGLTRSALRWGEQRGRWRRVRRGVYGDGPHAPTPLDEARATVLVTGGVASNCPAGVLHGLDGVSLRGRRRAAEHCRLTV